MTAASENAVRGSDAEAAPSRPPSAVRFGLRQMFLFVSGAAAVSALVANQGTGWQIATGMALAVVTAHIVGTRIGTILRDTSAEVQQWKSTRPGADRDEPVATPAPIRLAELSLPAATRLSQQGPAWRRGRWAVGAGSVAGFAGGVAGLQWGLGDGVTWPGLALGAMSCAAIGAWIALLATGFWAISRQALREAKRESQR